MKQDEATYDATERTIPDASIEGAPSRPPLVSSVATREMMQLPQELAATLLELSQDAIIIRDANDCVTFWNRGAHEIYGFSAEEALGRQINILLRTDPDAWRALKQELDATDFFDGELLQRRQDDTPILVHCREVLVRNEEGVPSAVLAIKRDVTEQQQAIDALREADRRKDEFLATLAHELRNPLAPIRNAVEIMRLAGDNPHAVERARDVLDRQARQLARIVDDLIDLARIVEKKVVMRRERVDVRTVVETALETSQPQMDEAELRLVVKVPDEPLYLDADPVRLSQVLVNLLNNSAKYTAAGGEVTLSVERSARRVDTSPDGEMPDQVLFRVHDTGSGIEPSLLPHVFEMFTQGPRATQQGQGGLGVGLALVRNLVHMHGGSVEATSAGVGQGTEFIVRLPMAAPGPVPDREADGAKEHDALGRKRIIVVDDNDDQVESLAMLLKMMGHSVEHANSGPEAIERAIEFRPDLMLIDIGMPGMEGYEVARRIRQKPDLGNVHLVAQTGWGGDVDRERSRAAGFDGHLVKPISPASIEEVLRSIDA
ncbi:MAG TPA: ATP-binding protein [Gemmatimonadaceae bacterium]